MFLKFKISCIHAEDIPSMHIFLKKKMKTRLDYFSFDFKFSFLHAA